MTPSELRYAHLSHNPESHFFDAKTMKFFGDTMSNYKVYRFLVKIKRYDESIVECHELMRKKPVMGGLQTSHFFADGTFELVRGEVVE